MARQAHGFVYEQHIIDHFHLLKCKPYTAKFDAYTTELSTLVSTPPNTPVQIKCIQYKSSIELGDYLRNKRITTDFILIIGFWQYQKSRIINQYIFYIDAKIYADNLRFEHDKSMYQELKLITNLKIDDVRWKKFCSFYRSHWSKSNQISLRFKRDHKTQKRIQCAIPWKSFQNYFLQKFENIKFMI